MTDSDLTQSEREEREVREVRVDEQCRTFSA